MLTVKAEFLAIYIALADKYFIYPSTGLTRLESLNIKWCNCITDADIKTLSGNLLTVFSSCSEMWKLH